jgi:hypothetical protein
MFEDLSCEQLIKHKDGCYFMLAFAETDWFYERLEKHMNECEKEIIQREYV